MKNIFLLFLVLVLEASAQTELKKSVFDTDSSVVYLADYANMHVILETTKDAIIFSDKNAARQIGVIKAKQQVAIDAITERAYRVVANHAAGIKAGWVGVGIFSSSKDPQFAEHLLSFYQRQIEVGKLIAAHQIALGMTMEEITMSIGKPTKSSMRQTTTGQSGKWEYVKYEEQKNYRYIQDPITGRMYRQLMSVTQIEKGRRNIEFANNLVTAIEDSEDHSNGNVRTIIPPIVFRWY